MDELQELIYETEQIINKPWRIDYADHCGTAVKIGWVRDVYRFLKELEPSKNLLDMSDEARANSMVRKLRKLKKYIPEEKEWMVLTDAMFLIKTWQPKNGKWIFTGQKNAYGGTVIQCPFCDDKYAAHDPSDEHFCRSCGAKLMD